MRGLAMVGFHQSYTYFTWRNEKAELEGYLTRCRTRRPTLRPNLFPNTPDILPENLQYGGHPHSRSAPPSPPPLADVRRLRRLRALRERGRRPGIRGVPRLREIRASSRDWVAAEARGPHPRPRISPGSTRSAAQHPALQKLRNLDRPQQRGRRGPLLLQAQRHAATGQASDDTVIVVVNVDPHGTRETGRPPRRAVPSATTGTTPSWSKTSSPASSGDGARPTTCASTRPTSPPTSSAIRKA